jgi:hypothetical protein
MATEEMKYMILHTWNREMIQMHGEKLTKTQWAIGLRSNGLHQELQFTDRYGKISVSATLQDDCKCVRFKMINYSHPYRQSRVYIPVTAEQEQRIFDDACRMADLEDFSFTEYVVEGRHQTLYERDDLNIWFGPNAIKYDTAGVSLSFISKRRWWNPSGTRQWCNETCGLLLMVVWPDIFEIKTGNSMGFFECKVTLPIDDPAFMDDWLEIYPSIPPHEQTPSQTEHLVRHYFDIISNIKE